MPGNFSMNIAVLCGGLSPERDVSITSGIGIANALKTKGHKVVLLDVYLGYTGEYNNVMDLFYSTGEDEVQRVGTDLPNLDDIKGLRTDGSRIGDNVLEICAAADIVFMALHGEDGENGNIQAVFDVYGIRYTGAGPLGSAMAMNKGVSKDLFEHYGIKTPFGCVVEKGKPLTAHIELPAIVKPCSGGSSVGVSIVRERSELEQAVKEAFKYENALILEKYIDGREFSVGIIDGEALPIVEICPKCGFYDYKNKYQSGMTDEYCPADLSEDMRGKIQAAALKVFDALRLEVYGRVDFMLDKDGEFYCLEANTLPGMTPLSLIPLEAAARGMSYADLCEKITEVSMVKYR